jgi:hypothetical protein
MTESGEAPLKVTKAPAGGCKPHCPSEQADYPMRGALYAPPEPGMPYLAIVLNAEDEVLSARSVPNVETGKYLIAKVSAAFASARSCENSSKGKAK